MRLSIRFTPLVFAALLGLCQFFILLPLLGLSSIGGSSEAREVHIASIVLQKGEWLLPLRDGLLPSKPPLFHWIAAGLGALSGQVTPATARLVSLIFGSGLVVLTALLTLRVAEAASAALRRDKYSVAVVAAIILVTTFGFQNMTADARVDMTYSFFVSLALYPIFSAVAPSAAAGFSVSELKKSWRWTLFFVACGCGVLAKGPIGFVLPCLIVFFALAGTLGWREAGRQCLRPRLGWLIFPCIALPWYFLASQSGGDGFINRQLLFENLRRFTGGESVNTQPVWYYVPEFLRTAAPWSVLYFAALPGTLRGLQDSAVGESSHSGSRALRRAFALWFLAGIVFLSFASGKRQSYLLPLFPGMAVFLALSAHQYFVDLTDRMRSRTLSAERLMRAALLVLLLLVAACFDVLRFPFPAAGSIYDDVRLYLAPAALTIEIILALLAVLLGISMLAHRSPVYFRFIPVYSALLGLMVVLIYGGLGVKNFMKGFDRAAPQILARVPADAKLSALRLPREEFFDPLLYYLNREVVLLPQIDAANACPGYVLAKLADFEKLPDLALKFEELHRFNSLDRQHSGKLDQVFVLARC